MSIFDEKWDWRKSHQIKNWDCNDWLFLGLLIIVGVGTYLILK